MSAPTADRPTLAQLARPSGALAMLAIDQRESLRAMFSAATGGEVVEDDTLSAFKLAAVDVLGRAASAVLLDRLYGLAAAEHAREDVPECGLMLAIDELHHTDGGPVTDTAIDPAADLGRAYGQGFIAAKLLVIWTPASEDRCVELAHEFVARCRTAGLPSVLEAIVRPGEGGSRESEIVRAAGTLGKTSPDLYKCEIPFLGDEAPDRIRAESERISAALNCPWVVLSSGVGVERFPAAVEYACRGGASGFLAGRAVWADAVGAHYHRVLTHVSLPRMRRLAEIVDEYARPWHEAVAYR